MQNSDLISIVSVDKRVKAPFFDHNPEMLVRLPPSSHCCVLG